MAVVAIMSITSTTAAASFGPAQLLRTGPLNAPLIGVDVEGVGTRIAVTWLELRQTGAFGFIRLSEDGGRTFEPRQSLTGGTGSLDICDDRA